MENLTERCQEWLWNKGFLLKFAFEIKITKLLTNKFIIMKKTLLVCFLAVMALTSCNRKKYVENYVGTYNMSLTPSLTMTLMGEEQEIAPDAVDGFVCVISQVDNSAEVTVTITENETGATPIFVANAECDEMGMHINTVTITETMSNETLGDMELNVNINAATALEPVNGHISWESVVDGTVGLSVMGLKVEAPLSGKIKFDGTKI